MKVRTRLAASFAYVLLVVIVALTVPLAIVLRDRARSELESVVLGNAQTIASVLNRDALEEGDGERDTLAADADRWAGEVGGRVVVLDADGTVLADSDAEDVAEDFATAGRPEVGRALDSQASAEVRRSQEEGGDIAVAAAPIIDEGELVGAVRISKGVRAVQENVGRATAAIVAVALGGLLAGLLLAFALARSLARPLSSLATAAHRLGEGELAARAGKLEGGAEIEELAGSFDEMAGRVERTLRSQREFVANASHQLRTPLTGIKLRLEAAAAETSDEHVREQLRAADREVDRLAQIIERLLTMASEIEEGRVPEADLGDAVRRAVVRWDERAVRASSVLAVDGAAGPAGRVAVDPDDLDQILDVLIDNAITHAPGRVAVSAKSDGSRGLLHVDDRGPGIPADESSRVTERFFRGRGAAPGGSGLGLAIARELAERWGGGLEVRGSPDGDPGTRIEVWFRAAPGP
ncbi:MAG TPA: ATP-binding protein [Actinomycetota bacterium]|nr:ATP-binding protein [Actinomycetota bacterium]